MDDLLQQGITAFRAGQRDEARSLFIATVRQNPNSEKAWAWMYDVSNTNQERVHCLKQMIRINPTNKKASQRYKELTASKPTSSSSGVALKPVVFIGIPLVCLVSAFCIGVLLITTNKITSTPTSGTPIPIEKIIEMTFSAADAQTAASYSPTPLSTLTLAPTITFQPMATLFIFETPTQTQLLNTPLPVYQTNTLVSLPTQKPPIIQATLPPQSTVCSCSEDTLNCGDFGTPSQAQACYNYCVFLGRGDVHRLDRDKDGLACEG